MQRERLGCRAGDGFGSTLLPTSLPWLLHKFFPLSVALAPVGIKGQTSLGYHGVSQAEPEMQR